MTLKIMNPCNGFTADLIRFVPQFRQLFVSWVACDPICEGTERFVDEYLPRIRANNPQVKYVLQRSHSLCDPFVVGTYNYDRKKAHRCTWKTAEQILSMVEEMSVGGDFRSGKRRGVNTKLPRGLQLWDTETIGHDVFEVYSKWKPDPPPRDAIRSKDHPNVIITYKP